jgi:hypothetical protein
MEEPSGEASPQYLSATDILKKRIIDYVFSLCNKACSEERPLDDNTYETGFIRGVKLAKSLLWKYMHEDIKKVIIALYTELDRSMKEIDKMNINEPNKLLNKKRKADEISLQVLELCLVVLQYSPLSTEFKEMEVFGNMDELIKNIRTVEPVKLFSKEVIE